MRARLVTGEMVCWNCVGLDLLFAGTGGLELLCAGSVCFYWRVGTVECLNCLLELEGWNCCMLELLYAGTGTGGLELLYAGTVVCFGGTIVCWNCVLVCRV